MQELLPNLLILMSVVWLVAILLRPFGIPTIMGELIAGVVLGPAVLGWIHPSETIEVLAEIGIFFLMLHAGVETEPREFFAALKMSWGVALVGAIVPFGVSVATALSFGLPMVSAVFVGLTMTATAVVVTLKVLQELGLQNALFSRVIVASCVIDDLLTLIVFSLVLGVLTGGEFDPLNVAIVMGKVIFFFAVSMAIGYYLYPRLSLPFHDRGGKGFTFVLVLALAAGLFAELIGLHKIIGAYLAGLFFEERIVNINLFNIVRDRLYGIAYSFLGPIFFISLGFNITFDLGEDAGLKFLLTLTTVVVAGQILSAGVMARRLQMSWTESLTVGVGMCGRAEMAFILASLGLAQGALDQATFSALVFTAFLLNLITPAGLKGCAVLLKRDGAMQAAPGITEHQGSPPREN